MLAAARDSFCPSQRWLSRQSCVIRLPVPVYGRVPLDVLREMEVHLEGWWCVRFGDALAWVEALSEAAAVRRSLDLHSLGDWPNDVRELVVSSQ